MAMCKEMGSKTKAGGNALLSKERWAEMDWDDDGHITFKEFLSAFYSWVGCDDDDEEAREEAKSGGGAE
jgi:hypothetical protein